MVKRLKFRAARDRLEPMLEVLSGAVGRNFEVTIMRTNHGGDR